MDYTGVFRDSEALLDIIKKADKLTRKVHGSDVLLERAIIVSWWCDKANCSFCYMSTQKGKIQENKNAKRSIYSILAEAELFRRLGWRIGFISGGYGAFDMGELQRIVKGVYQITKHPLWLNVGALKKGELSQFGDAVGGVIGSVETVSKSVRKEICPGKPLEPIEKMFQEASVLGLKKGATIILGVGETAKDLPELIEFVRKHELDKITLYSLNPHDSTPFENTPPPPSLYHAGVIAALRLEFPKLKITAGTWIDQLPNVGFLCLAGSTGITKYPFFKMFGNRFGAKVEQEIISAGRNVVGTFTDKSRLEGDFECEIRERENVEERLNRYLKKLDAMP